VGNELQAGFDLIGRMFGKRIADMAMFFLLNLLSVAAILLPIIGYMGLGALFTMSQNQSEKLMESIINGSINPYSMMSGILGVSLLILLFSLVTSSYIDSFACIAVKKAHENSDDGVGSTLSQAVSVWLRMIGFTLLLVLLVIFIAVIAIIAFFVFGMMIAGLGYYTAIIILILPLIVVIFTLTYHLGPLFIIAPFDVALTKTPVTQCFTEALTKAKTVKAPIFWIVILLGIAEFVLAFLIDLTGVPFLSTILVIPLAIFTPCLAYPFYFKYRASLASVVIEQVQPAEELEKPESTDDINPNL
jgi:hypothetical protein